MLIGLNIHIQDRREEVNLRKALKKNIYRSFDLSPTNQRHDSVPTSISFII